MVSKLNKKTIIKITIIAISFIILCVYLFYEPVKSVVNLLFLSFIVAYSVKPIRNFISEKIKVPIWISSIMIIILTLVLFGVLIYFIVPTVISESRNFGIMMDNIEDYLNNIAKSININDLSFFETAYVQINEKVNIYLASLSSRLIDNIASILENLAELAIVPIVTYYLLADGERIYNKLLLIFPTDKRVIIRKVNNNIDKVLSRYIVSQLVLSGIIGVLTFVMLVILKIKLPLILSVLNAIANIIPYFGPIIGGAPIVLIALIQSPSKAVLALVGAFLIQQIEGDLLAPKITGISINLHPITIIILLILGGKIGGAFGMVLAVPIAVVVKVVYDDINYYLF